MRSLQIAALVALVGAVVSAASLQTDFGLLAVTRRALRKPRTWLIGVPAVLVVFTLAIPFIYTRVVIGSPPEPLSFADLQPHAGEDARTAPTQAASTPVAMLRVAATGATIVTPSASGREPTSPIAGSWKVGRGSQAGYSIDDRVMGQTSRVVGRTPNVSGTATVTGLKGTSARVVVDMASVMCHCVHDSKYRELLEVEKYPTSTFVLTSPLSVSKIPPPGTVVTVPVSGKFTIHGVTRAVQFSLKATQTGGRIAVNGSLPVKPEDYGIDNPNAGAFGGLDNAQIDILLAFDRTS